ncbi:MAG: accessory factor UbiK family protein [Halobacteria archaeon]|nr:accessory factor UbiK family protein [Halobacteria archaeon]
MQNKATPNLDDMVNRLLGSLPTGMRDLKEDTARNLRAALHSTLSKMDLVTREEFDIQQGVLTRTRAKLEELEKQVAELEKELRKDSN